MQKLRQHHDEELDFQLNVFEDDMKVDQEELQIMADASFQGVNYKYLFLFKRTTLHYSFFDPFPMTLMLSLLI